GEFVPAARSRAMPFAPDAPAPRGSNAALFVDSRGRVEEIGNLWDQERILKERRRPKLRQPLRIAALAFGAQALGHEGTLAQFVSPRPAGRCPGVRGAPALPPACDGLRASRQVDGVHSPPLEMAPAETPWKTARAFSRAAERRLRALPPLDLLHRHEW